MAKTASKKESQPAVETEELNNETPENVQQIPEEARWYVVHSYSGYENKVKKNLEHRIESMDMRSKIFQVIVPTEEEIELKDGQRRVVERRVFPGYVLVQMIMDEQSWYVVRNTPNVTGFVGMGNKPTPLPDEEVKRILRRLESEEPKIKIDFKVGQKVRIVEGAFAEFTGLVQELYPDKGRAQVMVSFFNRGRQSMLTSCNWKKFRLSASPISNTDQRKPRNG
ncbi:MAG: transcription termination/antitermination protein NusG [Caldilineales bacterium]